MLHSFIPPCFCSFGITNWKALPFRFCQGNFYSLAPMSLLWGHPWASSIFFLSLWTLCTMTPYFSKLFLQINSLLPKTCGLKQPPFLLLVIILCVSWFISVVILLFVTSTGVAFSSGSLIWLAVGGGCCLRIWPLFPPSHGLLFSLCHWWLNSEGECSKSETSDWKEENLAHPLKHNVTSNTFYWSRQSLGGKNKCQLFKRGAACPNREARNYWGHLWRLTTIPCWFVFSLSLKFWG